MNNAPDNNLSFTECAHMYIHMMSMRRDSDKNNDNINMIDAIERMEAQLQDSLNGVNLDYILALQAPDNKWYCVDDFCSVTGVAELELLALSKDGTAYDHPLVWSVKTEQSIQYETSMNVEEIRCHKCDCHLYGNDRDDFDFSADDAEIVYTHRFVYIDENEANKAHSDLKRVCSRFFSDTFIDAYVSENDPGGGDTVTYELTVKTSERVEDSVFDELYDELQPDTYSYNMED